MRVSIWIDISIEQLALLVRGFIYLLIIPCHNIVNIEAWNLYNFKLARYRIYCNCVGKSKLRRYYSATWIFLSLNLYLNLSHLYVPSSKFLLLWLS